MNGSVYGKQIMTTLLVATACVVSTSGKAQAQSASPPVSGWQERGVYAAVGTNGLNLGYSQRFSERWGGRAVLFTGLKTDAKDIKINGNKYDGEIESGPGVGLFADFYPVRDSGFRVTGGLLIGKNSIEDLKAKPRNGSYVFNGNRYSAAAVGKTGGEADYNSVAPYLGIGWASPQMGSRWRLMADLGVKYVGEADAKLTATGSANNAALRRDLAAEAKKFDDKAYGVVASVGVSMSF